MATESNDADDATETITLTRAHFSREAVPDKSVPSEERKAELRAAYQEGSRAPYAGVEIRTLGEVTWICSERNWSSEVVLPDGMARPNFRRARLEKANLSGVNLTEANLSRAALNGADLSRAALNEANLRGARLEKALLLGATLDKADLSRARLDKADLDRARLEKVDLSFATLTEAHLRGARLEKANLYRARLSGATLQGAHLGDADLRQADLGGADLYRASLNSGTTLDGVVFKGTPPRLLGVRWNGAPLDGSGWNRIPRLGDEAAITKAKTRAERVQTYRDAARAYHGLIVALELQGLSEPARSFRRRERLMERRALRAQVRTWPAFAFYWLLNLVSGQGEAPERILAAYLLVVGSFTGLYWWLSHAIVTKSQQPLQWYEALVLSLSSFHGRGFFPSQIGLGDPLAIIAAMEAVCGLFIELILIATFSKRFLNS